MSISYFIDLLLSLNHTLKILLHKLENKTGKYLLFTYYIIKNLKITFITLIIYLIHF